MIRKLHKHLDWSPHVISHFELLFSVFSSLQDILIKAVLIRILVDVVIVAQLEYEESSVISCDVHSDGNPVSSSVLSNNCSFKAKYLKSKFNDHI